MYCKKCGKLIEDDAQFCKFCGEHVGTELAAAPRKNAVEWFQSKSRRSRLIMIIGLLWLFASFCFLVVFYSPDPDCYDSDGILAVILIFYGIPLVAWSVWYYIKYLRKGHNKEQTLDKDINNEEVAPDIINKQSDLIPLLDFAKENGKMQVGTYASGDSGIIKARCLFTRTTYVDFSPELGELSAKEISLKKEHLFVKRVDEQTFLLVSNH